MLLFQNGRFHSEKFSVLLPDGFYLEDDPEITCERGFCAWPPQKECLYCWNLYDGCRGSAAELANWSSPDCSSQPLTGIAPIVMNGLSGHFLLYKDRRHQYYEARFDLGDGEELSFLVEATGGDIRRIVKTPEFQAALSGIQAR